MCGICGIYALSEKGKTYLATVGSQLNRIRHRGPDSKGIYQAEKIALGHARLSIVDVSEASNQPFLSDDGQKALVFNGEIFNYKSIGQGLNRRTTGDVEVLLKLLETKGPACLNDLNGFFSFAFYDKAADTLLISRDRFAIKPLYYYVNNDVLVFASELKAILEVVGKQRLNRKALYNYFRFNYIPGPESIFSEIFQLPAGHYMNVKQNRVEIHRWYEPEAHITAVKQEPAQRDATIQQLLDSAVQLRLQADVPVGCFLSGGVDSSLVSALAARHHRDLHTFSIGFRDEPFFDETAYAEQVARHIGSKHHVFKLGNNDLFDHLPAFLDSMDEPFADSSALNVFILSKYTREHVKVALSGDGADELFLGYHKHRAEWMARHSRLRLLKPVAAPMLGILPKSRHTVLTNAFRQMHRFYASASLPAKERYLSWASVSTEEELNELFRIRAYPGILKTETCFNREDPYQALQLADLSLVLADDMLVKVDRMSMRQALEVRNPFLDYRVVEFALGLPSEDKITAKEQKVILRRAFSDLLPAEIFTRKKKGFEVPLLKWFNDELRSSIENNWLSDTFIADQGIFSRQAVARMKRQLYSSDPGDSVARTWGMIVFQHWYTQMQDYITIDA